MSRINDLPASLHIGVGVISMTLLFSGSAAADAPQGSNVYAPLGCTVGVDCEDVGDSMLVRTPHGVTMNIWTTSLDPNAVYTVWWIIFNNPAACAMGPGACMGSDLVNPEVNGCVQWATGHPIGGTGWGSFAARLNEGDTSGDQPNPMFPGCGVGLVDSHVAEIHLVLRAHGEIIPGAVYEQMSTFLGGCDDPDVCADQQFAVHP